MGLICQGVLRAYRHIHTPKKRKSIQQYNQKHGGTCSYSNRGFYRNCTPNFSKDESHALHISIVRQKTDPESNVLVIAAILAVFICP